MTLHFTKMHGLGNDFIVINAINQPLNLTSTEIAKLAKRDTGIGFDQCLVVEASTLEGIDFFYRIFNADGQEVGQCGNGARCLARFVHHYKLTQKTKLTVATHTTRMNLSLNSDETVTVDFGLPKLLPADIPLLMPMQASSYQLPFQQGVYHTVHALSVGNPHAIIVVPNVLDAPVTSLGQEISEHPLFPEQTNAGFMEILNPSHIKLRVYERGAKETRACGSGAVAAVAVGILFHQLAPIVEVSLPGGYLTVEWQNQKSPMLLTGPASFVYEGVLL